MTNGCIALAMDERHRRIEISTLRWSSGGGAWAGFPVESHQLGPQGQLKTFGTEHALLGLCVSGVGKMQIRESAGVRRVTSSPGRFTLLCRGYEQKPLAWSGMREMLYVSIPCLNIEPQYAVCDSHVVALVLNMRSEIESGCPSGRLYGEALSAALAARLRARYSHGPTLPEHVRSALSGTQVERICEYIRTNLAVDMGVAELAELVNLSPHYFSMQFRRALGVPPHQYVLQQRIAEARRLLAAGQMTLSELASSLGFADQSHFSRAFRRITGMTPRVYRRKS